MKAPHGNCRALASLTAGIGHSAFPASLPARKKPPSAPKRRRRRCLRSDLRTSEAHCATALSAISSALQARRRQHIPDFEPSSHRGYGDCFKGCWKQKANQADRHVNMNPVSILTAPIQKKQMRQLSASQYTISKHAPSFCGQCFSFTPSTVVAPQACIQGCDDLPQSIRPQQNVVQ